MGWTKWIPFEDLYEYYGLIDDTGGKNRSKNVLTFLDRTGPLHEDDGFRLRSNPSPASGAELALKKPLETTPCELMKGDRGCYWIRIEIPEVIRFDYIGQSSGKTSWGIPKRLTDHFRKLCSIPDSSHLTWHDIRGVSPTKRFTDASAKLKHLGHDPGDPLGGFFDKYVKIKLTKVPKTRTADKKIHRIERMAMAAYKAKYGEFPNLNERDETTGLEGLFDR
jgi:hypothetical protein